MDNANDIVELQQQVAFQEQTIDALNEVVSRQQQDLTRLDRALALLAQQMARSAASCRCRARACRGAPTTTALLEHKF